MAEYIEREALIDNLNHFAPEHYNALINMLIEKQPAADVVEVVRCKDCKWRNTGGCIYNCVNAVPREDYDFCSDGERRESK